MTNKLRNYIRRMDATTYQNWNAWFVERYKQPSIDPTGEKTGALYNIWAFWNRLLLL